MSYKSGFVIYSIQEHKKSNYVLEQGILIHHLGTIPKGSGSHHIWSRIDDLATSGELIDYTANTALHFKVLPVEDIELIKDGSYSLVEWLKYERRI